ncbi:MAG: TRAP transporter large permease subunit [Leptospirales bacterium]|jgi:tripartite ATP-independent transporter DctM subunit
MIELIFPILLFSTLIVVLLSGYPVAFSLAGVSLFFALLGGALGYFDLDLLGAFASRLYGIMGNETLLAIPLFVFMGLVLERSKISEELLEVMGLLFGGVRGGVGIAICIVGALLAASTGIVGATVVTMGLISLPVMLRLNYRPDFATGIVTASGTLGQIIPPSIILIILGDQISSAFQQAKLAQGDYSGGSVTVGDLFMGALLPGVLLVFFYIIYIAAASYLKPDLAPAMPLADRQQFSRRELFSRAVRALAPPLLLILGVLGSIMVGAATPTEAASVGCMGGLALAGFKQQLNRDILRDVMQSTLKINAMVFMILIGASLFSLVFRGYEGDALVEGFLADLPGGQWTAFFVVMLVMFVLGFFLDFFEITFVVVPIVGPVLLGMGMDPIWLGVMIALNLQTSFLTPPFGFALFYLRGVCPDSIKTVEIYRGVVPFIAIQLLLIFVLVFFPELATWLPGVIYPGN